MDLMVNGNSQEVIKKRLGHIQRKKEIPFLDILSDECKKRGIELLFDLNDIESERRCLIYTEFFGGLGGVMLRPQNFVRQFKQYNGAYEDNEEIKVDFSNFIDLAGDKYKLDEKGVTCDKLVLLCGSNLLGSHTKKELIQGAVNQGAMLKPHPITNEKVLNLLHEFWSGKVYEPEQSGFELYKNAKEIWTTRFSEFSLFSILQEKKLHFIDDNLLGVRGSYKALNLYLECTGRQNKESLNKILNSYRSGIFFKEFNIEEDIKKYLDFFESEVLGGK
jgi:hypothetical protein